MATARGFPYEAAYCARPSGDAWPASSLRPRRASGATRVAVKSYHHQGIARVGDGLQVTAHAAGDGTPEAVEDARMRFMLGVFWHPEEDEADRLIGAFVRECGA